MSSDPIRHVERVEVRVDFLEVGTTLSGNVYDEQNRLLFRSHIPFTRDMIDYLKKNGIQLIYYTPRNDSPVKTQSEGIEQFRSRARDIMDMLLEAVARNDRPDFNEARQFVRDLQNFIEADDSTLLPLMKIREYDDYTYTHSVNVGILSMMLAGKYGIDYEMVHDVGLGALLHDTGKLTIARELLNKQGKLSGDEIYIFRQHPVKGYEYMEQFKDVSEDVLAIIHQHHEWYNGNGYPRGLNDENMHTGAKFAAICDVYDALTTERSYKRAYTTSEALALIMRGAGTHFSPVLVSRFVRDMTPLLQKHPVFPPGTLVLLNTGEVAMVREVHSIGDDKPIVAIVTDNQRKRLARTFNIDLTMDATRNLEKVIRFADIPPE